MIRYEQKIFDFPICILKTAPTLIKNTSKGIDKHKTCTSFLVYLPPMNDSGNAVQKFIDIYAEKGRILCWALYTERRFKWNMSVLADWEIKELVEKGEMISPFEDP